MLRKFVRGVLLILAGLVVSAGILYVLGLRIVLDGGGGVHLVFTKTADQRAAEIEKHREAQRAQPPAPVPAPVQPDAAAAPDPSSSNEVKAAPVPR